MSAGNTPEARARHAAANASPHKGQASRKVSPWNKAPMCEGQNAMASWKRYRENGRQSAPLRNQ